jgi:hypothetical protein
MARAVNRSPEPTVKWKSGASPKRKQPIQKPALRQSGNGRSSHVDESEEPGEASIAQMTTPVEEDGDYN